MAGSRACSLRIWMLLFGKVGHGGANDKLRTLLCSKMIEPWVSWQILKRPTCLRGASPISFCESGSYSVNRFCELSFLSLPGQWYHQKEEEEKENQNGSRFWLVEITLSTVSSWEEKLKPYWENIVPSVLKGWELRHILAASRDLSDVTWCGHPILSCFKDMGAGGRLDTTLFSPWG